MYHNETPDIIAAAKGVNNAGGFTLIEVMLALALFSIGFMAITASINASAQNARQTAMADHAILACQDWVEELSTLPAAAINNTAVNRDGLTMVLQALNAQDSDGDGENDFVTMALSVFEGPAQPDNLLIRIHYRQ